MGIQGMQFFLFTQTMLWQGFQDAKKHLQGPILIYHDGENDEANIAAHVLSNLHPVLLAQVPEQPTSDKSRLPKSAVLIGKYPDKVIPFLRTWSLWNARIRVLVVAHNETDAFTWISALWSTTRAVNVVVMVPTENNVNYFTWFPYQRHTCENVTKIVKIGLDELFPEKVKLPLNGCALKAVTSILPPLVVSQSSGIEPRLFLAMAEKLGMTATYVSLPANKYVWSTLDRDARPANGLKMVWENEVDMTFSQLSRQYTSSQFAEFLPSHTQDTSVFFAPGPKPAARATAIYRAFSHRAWIVVILTSIAMYLSTMFIPHFEGRKYSGAFLETVALILNLPANLPGTRIFQYFAVVAYIYSVHVTTVYQSSLMVFLSDVPRMKPIRTWEDLDKSPFPVEFHEGQRLILQHVADPHIQSMLNRTGKAVYTPYLHMSWVAEKGDLAVLGPKLSFGSKLVNDLYYDEFGYPRVVVLSEHVFTSYLCFYVSKGHPLFPLMSQYTLQLIEGGMPEHYKVEVSKLARPVLRQLRPFSIENVEGPFVLYGAMLLVSFLTWIGECFYDKCIKSGGKNIKKGPHLRRFAAVRIA